MPTSFNIELEFYLPEFHRRLFAWLIDFAILVGYYFIMRSLAIMYISYMNAGEDNMPFWYNLNSLWLIFLTPLLVYHFVCEITMNGQSIGKRILGIKVIDETGSRPGLHQFLLRWLLRSIDFWFIGIPGLLSVLLTQKSQRIGDLAAGTIVIRQNVKTDLSETVFFEVNENYEPKYKDVLRLTDRDMNVIKNILDTCRRDSNYELARKTGDKIQDFLNISDYGDPIEFLETILKDYNYLSLEK